MENNFSRYGVQKDETEENETSYQSKEEHKLSSILVSNYHFIEWLEHFCINHPSFSDDDWDFYPIQLDMKDYENVKRLRLFYEGILEYTQKINYDVKNGSVFIKYGSIGYEICPSSTNKYHSINCYRRDISGSHDFIDFNDIMYHVAH